ncbi:MAG: class I SAM-dependent methyltransferase [Pseudomonadota bacterium]
MSDPETLAVYGREADRYRDRFTTSGPDTALLAFLEALPQRPEILDLGCGPGISAGHMAARGARVTATDAVPEMVALAAAIPGVDARTATFDELDADAAYDGVWANFCLLHAPRAAFPGHLGRIHRALRPGGTLHLGMKTGSGEARDSLGRHYVFYTPEELRALLETARFQVVASREGEAAGLAGAAEPFVLLRAKRV